MPMKLFDIESAISDLRHETASPQAKLQAKQALNADRYLPSFRLRWIAVAAAVGLAVLPIVMKSPHAESLAAEWRQSVQATRTAPIVHIHQYSVKNGQLALFSEDWFARIRSSRRFGGSPPWKGPVEFRRNGQNVFIRYHDPDYELLFRKAKADENPKEVSFTKDDLLTDLAFSGPKSHIEQLPDQELDGRKVKVYSVRDIHAEANGSRKVFFVDAQSSRLVKEEWRSGRNELTGVQIVDYPGSVPGDLFEPPPRTRIPRFDAQAERKFLKPLLKNGLRSASRAGANTKLLAIIQDPEGKVSVIYEGASPGADVAHPVSIPALHPYIAFDQLHRGDRPIIAEIFFGKRKLESVNVRVPLRRQGGSKSPSRWVGFTEFKNVPVHQGLPLSHYAYLFR